MVSKAPSPNGVIVSIVSEAPSPMGESAMAFSWFKPPNTTNPDNMIANTNNIAVFNVNFFHS